MSCDGNGNRNVSGSAGENVLDASASGDNERKNGGCSQRVKQRDVWLLLDKGHTYHRLEKISHSQRIKVTPNLHFRLLDRTELEVGGGV